MYRNTSLESVSKTKELAKNAINFYNTNFTYMPVGIKHTTQIKLPTEFSLSQNYPNPFNPSTTIKYSIPPIVGNGHAHSTTEVTLKVYNIMGQEVKTLVNQAQTKGRYQINFDASNLSSGVYFYKLTSGSFTKTMKMLLLK